MQLVWFLWDHTKMNGVPHASFDSPESDTYFRAQGEKRLHYTWLRKSVDVVFLAVYDPLHLGI